MAREMQLNVLWIHDLTALTLTNHGLHREQVTEVSILMHAVVQTMK